jgi:23S rRNA pseudouridine955/2504/2580 synthase
MLETESFSVCYLTIGTEDAGQRLDNFLLRVCKGVPRSHLYRMLRKGEVRVNKKRAEAACRLISGDQVRLPPMRRGNPEASGQTKHCPPLARFPILHEDDALLAIDKPSGIAAHGGSGIAFGVIETLRRQRPEAKFLELAHRLDKETSGILLIGKRRVALNRLHDMFREGGADKRYLMLVQGRWMNPLQAVRLPLRKYLTDSGERRVRVDHDAGKPAHSIFRLLARWSRFSLLEGELKTGRTHQLRVHLAHLGHPILGDEKYGDFECNRALQKEGLKRMALHAHRMTCPHPLDKTPLHLAAPLPETLLEFIRHLDATERRDVDLPFA